MSRSWMDQPERSTGFWLRTIVWIALRIGRPAARALLYPICAYFLLFSSRARRASIEFLSRIAGRPEGFLETFRHYHVFAQTILDRVFVFAGRDEIFRLDVNGFELLEGFARAGRGCLLVGAHMGSFEILRGLGRKHKKLPIKAMTYGENSPKINAIFRRLNPELYADIVSMGSPTSLLGTDEHIARGGMIAMLGDRTVHGEKRVLCRFLREKAWFPAAPVLLANLFKVPVILFYCLHRGNAHYEIHFELLAERIDLPRTDRGAVIQLWMQRYAERLEHYCRKAPYNWFNFYDFWDKRD